MKIIGNKLILISFLSMSCMGFLYAGDDNHKVNKTKNLDKKLQKIINARNLTGNAFQGKITPSIEDPKSQLGMHLFFSKSLSGNRDSACVTCHHPTLGGGDNLSLPIGVGAQVPDLLGEGRLHDLSATEYDGGPTVPRNAPTTFNLAAWNTTLFHDGRVEHVNGGTSTPDSGFSIVDPLAGANLAAAQSRFPLTSPEEMKGFNHHDKTNQQIREYVASRLGGYGEGAGELDNPEYWLNKFQEVYNSEGTAEELVTEQNIADAIGAYENSQTFSNTPWRRYIEGDKNAISTPAKKGALLFFKSKREGGANCVSCHSGDFFTDEKFHNIAMPQMGRGKGNGRNGKADFGRYAVTGNKKDKYAFRTPSLLNVEVTGPWSHTGAYTSLKAVVKHHLNPKKAIQRYNKYQLDQEGIQNLDKVKKRARPMLTKLKRDRRAGRDVIRNIKLNKKQIRQLVSFLKTLTDPCVKDRECLDKWIPSAEQDPNGDQLDAVDQHGNLL